MCLATVYKESDDSVIFFIYSCQTHMMSPPISSLL